MAKLVLSLDGAMVAQCFVESERLTIGRETSNSMVVDDPAVSREHAAIVCVGNDHILEDLRSANGTLVNGTRRSRCILQHGDVVTLGRYQLRYLNPKVAAEVDLERTMLIPGLAGADARVHDGATPVVGGVPVASPTTRAGFPKGRAWIGAGPRAGEVIELTRVVTMIGRPGNQAVITRRPLGYYVTHVDGKRVPRVNGTAIGREPRLLRHGDIVEAGGERIEFTLDEGDRRRAPRGR
jgi:pSer/pThr/pTyr-binding forkhead associated (FHA) protein